MQQPDSGWYVVDKAGDRRGPYSRVLVISKLASGELNPRSLVWFDGMDGWETWHDIQARVPPPGDSPQQRAGTTPPPADGPGGESTQPGTHPWRRYFAKLFDIFTMGLGAFVVAVMIGSVVSPDGMQPLLKALDNQIIAGLVIMLVWIPMEATCLSLFGTTLGRAIFGIKLRTAAGGKLGFGEAMTRSFGVAFAGMGGSIPIVTMFTHYFAYSRLTKSGTTSWDEAGKFEVSHADWGFFRALFAVTATLVILVLVAALNVANKYAA